MFCFFWYLLAENSPELKCLLHPCSLHTPILYFPYMERGNVRHGRYRNSSIHNQACSNEIHESTISLRFLALSWDFSDLRFLPSFLRCYKMLFMNKLEFSLLFDSFVCISETIEVVRFSVRFSLFQCISYCGYCKEKMYLSINIV